MTTKHFEKIVDLRSRKAMVNFLQGHFRYDTMNSWNKGNSYANKVKIHTLGLTKEQLDKAYELIFADESIFEDSDLSFLIEEFTEEQGGCYTIGSNGRSSGYLVLYNSCYESTNYKSYCRSCGQQNFKKALTPPADPVEAAVATALARCGKQTDETTILRQPEIEALGFDQVGEEEKVRLVRSRKAAWTDDYTADNKCGRCGAVGDRGRGNYAKSPVRLRTSAEGIDQEEDFHPEDWSMDQLRDRVKLVQAFDRTCDAIRTAFIHMLDSSEVVEEVVMAPKTVRRVVSSLSAD